MSEPTRIGKKFDSKRRRAIRITEDTIWADNGVQLCGKINKKGQPCRMPAKGNGRCPRHGGNNLTHRAGQRKRSPWNLTCGIYSDFMTTDELDAYGALQIGTLEEEIRMIRLQLRRAVRAQDEYDAKRDELNSITIEEGLTDGARKELDVVEFTEEIDVPPGGGDNAGSTKRKIARKLKDRRDNIVCYTKLLESLESSHAVLVREKTGETNMVEQIARDLRKFGDEAAGYVPTEVPDVE